MPVVTIAREFGAGGSAIAAFVAADLGAEIVDKRLIGDISVRASLPSAVTVADDERATTLRGRLAHAYAMGLAIAAGGVLPPEQMVDPHLLVEMGTRQALGAAARFGNVVIVGRGAAVELRDLPGACHAYLRAPLAARIRAVRERESCDEATAARRIREVDGERAAFVREVYGVDWHDPTLYDLVLDTSRLGHRGAAAVIVAALRARDAITSPDVRAEATRTA